MPCRCGRSKPQLAPIVRTRASQPHGAGWQNGDCIHDIRRKGGRGCTTATFRVAGPGHATQHVERTPELISGVICLLGKSLVCFVAVRAQRGQMIATDTMAVAGALPGRWNGLRPFLTFVSPLTMTEGTPGPRRHGVCRTRTSAAPPSLSSERRWSRPPRWQRKPTSGIVPAT